MVARHLRTHSSISGSKDLDKLNPGDAVTQDSGYTPRTSAVTNVDVTTYGPAIQYASKNPTSSISTFDGESAVSWATGTSAGSGFRNVNTSNPDGSGNYMIIKLDQRSGISVGRVPDGNGTAKLWGCNEEDASDGWTFIGESSGTRTVTSDKPFQFYVYQLNPVSFMDFGVYYPTAAAAVTPVTLTLTNNTDLENFRVGDLVGGTTDQYAVSSNPAGAVIYRNQPSYTDTNVLTIDDFETLDSVKVADQSTYATNYGSKQYEVALNTPLDTSGDSSFFC